MSENELLKKTFELHGHICWAGAIGARAGMVALRELGVKRTGTSGEPHCTVQVNPDAE